MYYISRKIEPFIMNNIIKYFLDHSGYARMRDLKEASFHTRDIAKLLKEGKIEKIKPGYYRLTDMNHPDHIPQSFIDVVHLVPKGVICLLSALEYHNLTTFNPSEVYVAIPQSEKFPEIKYPPIRGYYFPKRFYSEGIEYIESKNIKIKIYSAEKSIADMFRYRKKLGEDIAIEALKTYLARKEANINRLYEYAETCQVKTVMNPYIKAIVG